jgi:hypothetical protein
MTRKDGAPPPPARFRFSLVTSRAKTRCFLLYPDIVTLHSEVGRDLSDYSCHDCKVTTIRLHHVGRRFCVGPADL